MSLNILNVTYKGPCKAHHGHEVSPYREQEVGVLTVNRK